MTVRRSPLAFLAIMLGVTAERMGMVEKAMEELKQKFPEFFEVVADVGEATAKLIRETYEALQDAMNTRLLRPEESFAKTEKGIDKITSATNRLSDAQLRLQSISQSVESSFENAMMSMIDGTTSAKDAFRAMARDIIKELYRIFFVKQITGFISRAIDLQFGGALIGFGGVGDGRPAPDIPKKAMGGPVSAGRPYLVGERGPELMIPRSSGSIVPNNKLGGVTIHQTFQFAANGDESVKKLIAQAAPQIAKMTEQGIMDSRRRGGQMKAVFG